MTVMGNVYTEWKEAGKEIELGEYRVFPMKLMFDGAKFKVVMKQRLTHTAELSYDVVGNIMRINIALEKIPQSHAKNIGIYCLPVLSGCSDNRCNRNALNIKKVLIIIILT